MDEKRRLNRLKCVFVYNSSGRDVSAHWESADPGFDLGFDFRFRINAKMDERPNKSNAIGEATCYE